MDASQKSAMVAALFLAACATPQHTFTDYYDACVLDKARAATACTMMALQACDIYGCRQDPIKWNDLRYGTAEQQYDYDHASKWLPISSAPKDGTVIRVRCEDTNFAIEFLASWQVIPDSREDGDGWGWIAKNDNEHPPCWHDGICWESNADESPSNYPAHWRGLAEKKKS